MEQTTLKASIEKAFSWIDNNSITNEGIIVNSQMKVSYPEVTGYYIPTLLTWSDTERAITYGQWLCEVQHESGSWRDPAGEIDCIFDTGQIFRGLLEIYELTNDKKIKESLQKSCQWLSTQIDDDGVIDAPDVAAWDGTVPDYILLYALEPILRVATLLEDELLILKAKKAIDNFLTKPNLTEFSCLSHFHAYIIEALCDLGSTDRALEGMKIIEKLQRDNGSIPAYKDKKWVCSTAMFQYSIVWYKLGKIEQADKTFNYAISLQNSTGGWYGSYGEPFKTLSKLGRFIPSFGMYFPKAEISWAVKYFLDATELYMKNKNISKEF